MCWSDSLLRDALQHCASSKLQRLLTADSHGSEATRRAAITAGRHAAAERCTRRAAGAEGAELAEARMFQSGCGASIANFCRQFGMGSRPLGPERPYCQPCDGVLVRRSGGGLVQRGVDGQYGATVRLLSELYGGVVDVLEAGWRTTMGDGRKWDFCGSRAG